MSRNLFLLAAALQLPVALWMQGCGKDEQTTDVEHKDPARGSDEKPPKPPAGEPPSTQGDIAPLTKGGHDHQASIKSVLDIFKFADVPSVFDSKTKTTTAHVFAVDAVNKENSELKLQVDVEKEFFLEDASGAVKRQQNSKYPAVVTSKHAYHFVSNFENCVVLDPKNNKFVDSSAAQIVYVQNGVNRKASEETNLVAEIFTADRNNLLHPQGNPSNLMSVYMPVVKDANDFYDLAYKAYMMVIFHNVVISADVEDEEQLKLFKQALEAKKNDETDHGLEEEQIKADIFQYFQEKGEEKKATRLHHVGASHPIRWAAQNKDGIELHMSEIRKLGGELRAEISRIHERFHTRVPFLKGEAIPEQPKEGIEGEEDYKPYKPAVTYDELIEQGWYERGSFTYKDPETKLNVHEKWNLQYYSHFKMFVEYALDEDKSRTADILQDIRFHFEELYTQTTAQQPERVVLKKRNFNDIEKSVREVPKFSKYCEEPQSLDFPYWFLKNLFTSDRDIVPKEGESWENFKDSCDDWEKDEAHHFPQEVNVKVFIPEFKYEAALKSYVVRELVLVNTGMNPELVKAMCLGVHAAHKQTKEERHGPRDDLGKQFVLGDISTLRDSHKDKDSPWPREYMGPTVTMPKYDQKKHGIEQITCIRTAAQKDNGIEEFKLVLEQFLEKEAVHKPVGRHEATSLKTD
jgi:hypothetical protein